MGTVNMRWYKIFILPVLGLFLVFAFEAKGESGASFNGFKGMFGVKIQDLSTTNPMRMGKSRLNRVKISNQAKYPFSPDDSYFDSVLTKIEAAKIQRNLKELGLYNGLIDGLIGPKSIKAIKGFRASNGYNNPVESITKSDFLRVEYAVKSDFLLKLRSDATSDKTKILYSEMIGNSSSHASKFLASTKKRNVMIIGSAVISAFNIQKTAIAKQRVGKTIAASGEKPTPSRAFAGPNQYPPTAYQGYGILAFKSLATKYDIEKHRVLCAAYTASFPATASVTKDVGSQFLTIWPVGHDIIADELNKDIHRFDLIQCETAIASYDLGTSKFAIDAAKKSGFVDDGVGPYLLAWSPSSTFGKKDIFVLSLDLSSVEDFQQALALMSEWRADIENDFELLSQGFSLLSLKVKLRRWADRHGPGFLSFFEGGK